MRIAYYPMGGEAWPAGTMYPRNLFHALRQVASGDIELFLLAPAERPGIKDYAQSVQTEKLIPYRMPHRWTPSWAINGVIKRLSHDTRMAGMLKRHGINVVFAFQLVAKIGQVEHTRSGYISRPSSA